MFCFSVKKRFSAVLMLNTGFLLWIIQLIQIVFDVERQFSLERNFNYSSFPLHFLVYDPRFTCKE